MPNWVFNNLTVSGDPNAIQALKEQLNRPVTTYHTDFVYESTSPRKVKLDSDGNAIREIVENTMHHPVFSFMNVIAPTDLAAYYGDETFKPSNADKPDGTFDSDVFMAEFVRAMSEDNDWYHWNVRNWGTKWDIAVADDNAYPETRIIDESDTHIQYAFNTAWSPVDVVLTTLSEQYPYLHFYYSYEEEQGWGGEMEFHNGVATVIDEYDIPNSHEDYVSRDQTCVCEWSDDFTFDDCPPVDSEAVGV